MKYREQLLYLIFEAKDAEALDKWIEEQPLLEQPDIFRAIKELSLELGVDDETIEELTDGLDEQIDQYEESILDEKLAEVNYIMALEEQEKVAKKIETTKIGIRKYILDCIINQESNAEEMKALAMQVIDLEKAQGDFNPDNWSAIL